MGDDDATAFLVCVVGVGWLFATVAATWMFGAVALLVSGLGTAGIGAWMLVNLVFTHKVKG